ncbi:MAG TPA: tetratricopeptide repeat protein [Polyangiaceae bacterium LLY-WYZ-15_(1-7)]|nr:tetratricopeptide repeat protein [Polyangiaceae bacterium LLY-WYZ-15_(1-7)]HJL00028.1 tetratricopeptide repeat protein [Polyangiaceae bacterium LLY-WYZ-15_(1-7)]HJL12441.1 tetratricopeptide repeat protein [Polyangiaceae bacterium LLY-WYZ-15_(1-7)]HJL24089.1 tetratricopeptide repeat protein [Polyangiaceae bacterium LLY-WYZ-15_(1-7)]HJL32889.1 tetratricopeptide repeat protein [Polyangiaceae bacterium LLY-WYZ-15_(1-7)]
MFSSTRCASRLAPLFGALLAVLVVGGGALPAAAQESPRSPRRGRAERLHATGQALVAAGNAVSASSHFRRAIQVDPSFAAAYVALAEIYLARGDVGAALEAVRVGIRREPGHVPLHLTLARALREGGDRAEALEVLRRLVDRAPRSVAARLEHAALARARGSWSEALSSYRALLAMAEEGEDVPAEAREDARRYAAALRLLVPELDPTRQECEASPLRAALCAADSAR